MKCKQPRHGELHTTDRTWSGGFLGMWEVVDVKMTLDVPDDLFREAKSKAVLEGRKLEEFVIEGLRLRMEQTSTKTQKSVKFPLDKSKSMHPLDIPEDIASRLDLADAFERNELISLVGMPIQFLRPQKAAASCRTPRISISPHEP